MTSVYVAALAIGFVIWVGRAWLESAADSALSTSASQGDVSLPGAPGERSDDYAAAGGVGGAEGEGGAPGSVGAADGGIGGAEGGGESSRQRARRLTGLGLAALTFVAFGAIGIGLRLAVSGLSEPAAAGIAALGAIGIAGIAGSPDRAKSSP